MNIAEVKNKFYKQNPNTLANFVYNEKLGQYVCFVYDYANAQTTNGFINNEVMGKMEELHAKLGGDPFLAVLEYFDKHGIKDDHLEKISDYYYDALMSGKTFNSVEEVCNGINSHMQSETNAENKSSRSLVTAYIVNENGTLSNDRIFYMEVKFIKSRTGERACKIENTFTEENFRGNGLHSYGIKFLEAVLAKKHIFTLVGESMECDVYETGTSLNNHYKKLGFEVTTNKNGESRIIKDVNPENTMQLTEEEYIK